MQNASFPSSTSNKSVRRQTNMAAVGDGGDGVWSSVVTPQGCEDKKKTDYLGLSERTPWKQTNPPTSLKRPGRNGVSCGKRRFLFAGKSPPRRSLLLGRRRASLQYEERSHNDGGTEEDALCGLASCRRRQGTRGASIWNGRCLPDNYSY